MSFAGRRWLTLMGRVILYFFPIVESAIRLKYATLMGRTLLNLTSNQDSFIFETTSGKILYQTLKPFSKPLKQIRLEKEQAEYPYWILPYLRKFQVIKNMEGIAYIWTLILLTLSLCVAAVIQYFATGSRLGRITDVNGCINNWEPYFIYAVAALFLLVLCPAAVFLAQETEEDVHHINQEVQLITVSNLAFVTIFFVWLYGMPQWLPDVYVRSILNFVSMAYTDKQNQSKVPPNVWIIAMTVVAHIISIVEPVLASFQHDRRLKSCSREEFNRILSNPNLFDIFKFSTVPDFTTQNVFFELHIQEVVEQVLSLTVSLNITSDTPVPEMLLPKFGEIYRLYLCSDSPLKLDVPDAMIAKVKEKIMQQKIPIGVFDEIRNYVHYLLFIQTYPRTSYLARRPKKSLPVTPLEKQDKDLDKRRSSLPHELPSFYSGGDSSKKSSMISSAVDNTERDSVISMPPPPPSNTPGVSPKEHKSQLAVNTTNRKTSRPFGNRQMANALPSDARNTLGNNTNSSESPMSLPSMGRPPSSLPPTPNDSKNSSNDRDSQGPLFVVLDPNDDMNDPDEVALAVQSARFSQGKTPRVDAHTPRPKSGLSLPIHYSYTAYTGSSPIQTTESFEYNGNNTSGVTPSHFWSEAAYSTPSRSSTRSSNKTSPSGNVSPSKNNQGRPLSDGSTKSGKQKSKKGGRPSTIKEGDEELVIQMESTSNR